MTEIKAGHLYSGPRRSEHSQGWFIPVMDSDGSLALVDTYVIKGVYSQGDKNTGAAIEQAVELGSEPHPYTFGRIMGDYYHGYDYIVRCKELPDGFEDVCYLPDWEYVWDRAAEDYDPDDIIPCVQLYFEHGYRWSGYHHGVSLRRKGASKNPECTTEAAIAETYRLMQRPRFTKGLLKNVDKAYAEVTDPSPILQAKVRHLHEIGELVSRMEAECDALEREYDEEIARLAGDGGRR